MGTDTSLEGGIVSFVIVAVGGEVGQYTVSIDISNVSDEALTDDSVKGLVSSARLA